MTALVPEDGFVQVDESTLIYRREAGFWLAFGEDGSVARVLAFCIRETKARLLRDLIKFVGTEPHENVDIRLFAKVQGLDLEGE